MLFPDDPRHGTENGYNNCGCRCNRCREAHRLYMRDKKFRRRMREVPTHGTISGYYNWECRCDLCTEAMQAYQRRLRKRKTPLFKAPPAEQRGSLKL